MYIHRNNNKNTPLTKYAQAAVEFKFPCSSWESLGQLNIYLHSSLGVSITLTLYGPWSTMVYLFSSHLLKQHYVPNVLSALHMDYLIKFSQ